MGCTISDRDRCSRQPSAGRWTRCVRLTTVQVCRPLGADDAALSWDIETVSSTAVTVLGMRRLLLLPSLVLALALPAVPATVSATSAVPTAPVLGERAERAEMPKLK